MKKLVSWLFVAALFGLVITSCGKDDPDEPVVEKQQLESEHGEANDTYLVYDIDLSKDSSTIYVYNAVFRMGETTSPALTVRVDAPCTVDKSGKVYRFSGTGITPYLMRGTPVPVPTLSVNNLNSVVDVENKTYSISFDCHGVVMGKEIDGHYDKNGKLK